ncbi:MAG: hypothetical protein ACI837_001749 [Crocinitomicaceae bacterium]|jgi:hypothetical protein
MKNLLTTIFTAFLTLLAAAQGESKIMNAGIGPADFAIDKDFFEVEDFIIKSSRIGGDDHPSSTYKINLKRAHLEEYYGFKVDSGYVQFNKDYSSDSDEILEDVYTVILYLEKPSDSKMKYELRSQLALENGKAEEMWTADYQTLIGLKWWGDVTILDINLGLDLQTGRELDYYMVSYSQAYE